MTAHPTIMTQETIQISQNRFHIAGHSLKKCDSSTSLMVEAHCMLYPVKWASLFQALAIAPLACLNVGSTEQ